VNQFAQIVADLGLKLGTDTELVRSYTQERTEALARATGEAGYAVALEAEAMNVALYAAGRAVDVADAADAALVQTFKTVLAIGVRLLV